MPIDDDDADAADDFYSSMAPTHAEEEESDFSCQESDFVSGSFSSSSSESEPEIPDSLMDEFLLEEEDDEDEEDHVHLFDSCDDSPWSGIINRFSTKASAAAATFASIVACDEPEEDELPPFDDWYQSIAARTLVTMTA